MADHYSRRAERARNDARGYCIIAAGTAGLAALAGLLVLNRPPARDPSDCLASRATPLHTIAVIDKSDRWTAPDGSLLRAALTAMATETKPDERLTLIAFTGSAERSPQPLFDRCRPADASSVNPLFVTPARAEKKYQADFAGPLTASFDRLSTSGQAKETKLVAFLAQLAGTVAYEPRALRTRIRIFSDMGENSAAGSLLPGRKRQFDAASFTPYLRQHIGDRLEHITLEIVQIPSPSTTPAVARHIKATWIAALDAARVSYSWRQL